MNSAKGNIAFLMSIVSICPETCKFCNKVVLAVVSGSFPKLIRTVLPLFGKKKG